MRGGGVRHLVNKLFSVFRKKEDKINIDDLADAVVKRITDMEKAVSNNNGGLITSNVPFRLGAWQNGNVLPTGLFLDWYPKKADGTKALDWYYELQLTNFGIQFLPMRYEDSGFKDPKPPTHLLPWNLKDYFTIATNWHASSGTITRMTELDEDEFPQWKDYFSLYDTSAGTFQASELNIRSNIYGTCAKFYGYAKVRVDDSITHKGNTVVFALRTNFKMPEWKGLTISMPYCGAVISDKTSSRVSNGRNWCGVGIGKSGTVAFLVMVNYAGTANESQAWNAEWIPYLHLLYSPDGSPIGV